MLFAEASSTRFEHASVVWSVFFAWCSNTHDFDHFACSRQLSSICINGQDEPLVGMLEE
jgi:hypothetical protein